MGLGDLTIDDLKCEIMCDLDNDTRGNRELDDYDNPSIDIIYKLDNDTFFQASVVETSPFILGAITPPYIL